MDLLAVWAPVAFFLIVAVVASVYQMRSYGRHVDRVQKMQDEMLALSRESIIELREIKEILKDRR
jgi:hypothetical protein